MATIFLFILGFIFYSFVEYATHRWLLHGPMKATHQIHHRYPARNSQTTMLVVVPVAVTVTVLCGLTFAVGMVVCWLVSGRLHQRLHVGTGPVGLQAHHMLHHRRTNKNFGVSTTLWDRLFRTHQRP